MMTSRGGKTMKQDDLVPTVEVFEFSEEFKIAYTEKLKRLGLIKSKTNSNGEEENEVSEVWEVPTVW